MRMGLGQIGRFGATREKAGLWHSRGQSDPERILRTALSEPFGNSGRWKNGVINRKVPRAAESEDSRNQAGNRRR